MPLKEFLPVINPRWIAPRNNQDWFDSDIFQTVTWFKEFVPKASMQQRLDAVELYVKDLQLATEKTGQVPEIAFGDQPAWMIYQMASFSTDRNYFFPSEISKYAPFFTRIGKELGCLKTVVGVDDRVAKMMKPSNQNPATDIFELVVALAYKRHGYGKVEFIPELRGKSKTPDLHIEKGQERWAVECKRMQSSEYSRREKQKGENLSKAIHKICRNKGTSICVSVNFISEIDSVPNDYLEQKLEEFFEANGPYKWEDQLSTGLIHQLNWDTANAVFNHDDIYFGSSRMIELFLQQFDDTRYYSITADWLPSKLKPLFAEKVTQLSIVTWSCLSKKSRLARSRHFKKVLAKAEKQLPSDLPGIVHIGMDSIGNDLADNERHTTNTDIATAFNATRSNLKWVYGNHFLHELTTRPDESWAMEETMVPYKIGMHNIPWPLPGHMLLTDEGETRSGTHWDQIGF